MNEIFLKNIRKFIDQVDEILNKFAKGKEYPIHIEYLIDNCNRTFDILSVIEILLGKGLKSSVLEHPIGLLLRSGLYDFVNFQYISNQSINDEILNIDKFELEVREYMNGHFNKIEIGLDLDVSLRNLDKFRDFGKSKKYRHLGILKEGRSFALSKNLNYLQAAIDIWEWYSKYEHYGVFTSHMINRVSENKNRIKVSINLLYLNIYFSLIMLIDCGIDFLKLDDIKLLEEYCLSID